MSYENLDVWKRSCRLSTELYLVLASCKDYGFKDQITRSGLSIPSNIAEGYERSSVKEKRQFLYYAKGSSAELRTQILIGQKVGFIPKQKALSWAEEILEIRKILNTLIKQC